MDARDSAFISVAFRTLEQRRRSDFRPLSRLNCLPACSPVNASRAALRLRTHDSGPGWLAGPYLYDCFIRDFTPAYPGALQLRVHRPAEALLSAQRAVLLAPNSAEAHYVLGRSLLDSGKLEDAVKELQAAAQLNPGSPEVHFNLAKVYAKLNRREDAERERALFATLNAEIEKQRSQQGS